MTTKVKQLIAQYKMNLNSTVLAFIVNCNDAPEEVKTHFYYQAVNRLDNIKEEFDTMLDSMFMYHMLTAAEYHTVSSFEVIEELYNDARSTMRKELNKMEV